MSIRRGREQSSRTSVRTSRISPRRRSRRRTRTRWRAARPSRCARMANEAGSPSSLSPAAFAVGTLHDMNDITPRNGPRETRDGSVPAAIILLSGGLDSTTLLAQVTKAGYHVVALTFRYGQRHRHEVAAAARIAAAYGATHRIVDIDLRAIGGSALTTDIEVPKDRAMSDMAEGIPVTYVPARNTIFLSYALAWAEVEGARDIFIGV